MPVQNLTFQASTALTAAGTTYSEALEVDRYDELMVFLRVTVQGAYTDETLDIYVESKDPDGNYYTLADSGTDIQFTQVTDQTAGLPYSEYIAIAYFGSVIRFRVVAAGTAVSYTYSITGYGKRT